MKRIMTVVLILLLLILFLTGNFSNIPSAKDLALNKKKHAGHPWKVHEIAKDFELLDVWEFPILADKSKNQDFHFFLKIMREPDKNYLKKGLSPRLAAAGFLVLLRNVLGKIFNLDKDVNTLPIPGCKETSVRERLSEEDRRENLAEQENENKEKEKERGFRTVYLYKDEILLELSNNTVHALMHVGWVHKHDKYYTAQLAVYVKTRGWLGCGYMKLINPFRRHIVYPVMMDYVKSRWEESIHHTENP